MGPSIIAFPLSRQRQLVSSVADALRSRQGESATLFWRETAKDLLRQLAANGVEARLAEDQVRNLLYAVVAELETDAVKASG
jgi:hypothetical protein